MSAREREQGMQAESVKTIYEKSKEGRRAAVLPAAEVPERPLEELIPASLLRSQPPRQLKVPGRVAVDFAVGCESVAISVLIIGAETTAPIVEAPRQARTHAPFERVECGIKLRDDRARRCRLTRVFQ